MESSSSSASMSARPYMARHRRPPSQGWRTFLLNHANGIASIDLFVVPTISFRLLYGLLILRHDRRRILWLGVTAHPTAEWITQQFTEACTTAFLEPATPQNAGRVVSGACGSAHALAT